MPFEFEDVKVKIVIMHARAGQAGQLTLGGMRLAALLGAGLIMAAGAGAALQRYSTPMWPAAHAAVAPIHEKEAAREAAFVRENINMLAAKVGALQAKLVSIDGLGRRVAEVAGVAYTDPELAGAMAQEATGAMDDLFTDAGSSGPIQSAEDLGRQLDLLQSRLSAQADSLSMLDVALTRRSADQARLPTAMPVRDYPYLSSSYGWRRHPVTGRYSMHEGLDFSAPTGTPILAASGGVVLDARYHAGYGNMVEIDHGDGLVSRYAHARKLLVSAGDLVERGQPIALVGSTGRSTGPHLHFEVRMAGQPLDPKLFLGKPSAPAAVADASGEGSAHLQVR